MWKSMSLFLMVNVLVLVTISIVTSLLGFPYILEEEWVAFIIFCAIAGFSGSLFSLLISRFTAKIIMGVELIDPLDPKNDDERFLLEETYRLAQLAGLRTMPEVGIYESEEVNAFATGPSKRHSLVAYSTGLIHSFDQDAISAIAAHEVAHIKNGDMVTTALLQGVLNTMVIFVSRVVAILAALLFKSKIISDLVYYIVSFVLDILISFLASLFLFWHSRHREYHADRLGAKLAGKDKMIHALESLQDTVELVDTSQRSLATFKISGGKINFNILFSTHPPLEKRIERLKTTS